MSSHRMSREYREIDNISERVFSAKDYTYQGHVIKAAWIKERFDYYKEMPVKKRVASVAGDIRELLRSLIGMWGGSAKGKCYTEKFE